ncbi:efflux RND transporter periplasmic adaptor subunit [Paraburkholderia largidicola]|jgi:RND family efflux transporter MFP subunit|uniref:Secretion protein HlyD n=1 Tax=Paraburkholderia largidicola TaxID=3014751 RepID=A0A7I8C191_9BURK|nr:efflux RND transporter periplasmic adaptor subunit [Paraburkholderia sp. PGU16]BCF93930.1 secretion protein HlyD [Paraburkholderia sp. PGU16]GJH32236.1 efflux RND transporter periplasmic adaptor subunit [Paraburkholderia hospita]
MTEKTHSSLAIPARETPDGHALPPRHREWRRAKIAVVIVLILLAIGALRTVVANIMQSHSIAQTTQQNAKQYVDVVTPKQTDGSAGVTVLPGTLRGYVESPIFARATGYLLHWYADIGARVQEGQLLAELDTPEIDQELAQAVAQRDQIQSSLGLAKSSYERWQQLRQRDAVSQQELDERQSTYSQDVANLAAAEANVKRLRQLESFKRIVAPFAGVVTQRNVDVGDLIDAGSGTSRALFALAQSDPLRVFVQLPQAYAQNIKVGEDVVVTQAELPGQQFNGRITHISGAIDVPTRSLQVEVTLPNPDGKLRPGAYVQVALPSGARAQLTVPGNALLFRAEGPRVAVVDNDGVVHLRKVTIAQDLGQTLEIENGIEPNDRVIINPSDSIEDGDHVVVTRPQSQSQAKGKAAS